MFGSKKVAFERDLWQKIEDYAAVAGYSSAQEFVIHAVDKALAELEEGDSDEEIRKKLKGLGYIS
jgi:hypothetical protein